MKRIVAISLLVLYINSYTELHELLRVPVLLEHYQEHREQVKDMSFVEFLCMHYKSDVSHDNQDNQLPFKDADHAFTSSAPAIPIQKITLLESVPLTQVTHFSVYRSSNVAHHLADIFQPPRIS